MNRDIGGGRAEEGPACHFYPQTKIFSIEEVSGWGSSFWAEVITYFKSVNGKILRSHKYIQHIMMG